MFGANIPSFFVYDGEKWLQHLALVEDLTLSVKLTAGVHSQVDFQEGDLILKDQMLFGAQHSSNKVL